MKQRSYSLQKVTYLNSNKKYKYQQPRLKFPQPGDSGIYSGVGKKHYWRQYQEQKQSPIIKSQSSPKLIRQNSLNVKDIEGTTPSLLPTIVKNKMKGYSQHNNDNNLFFNQKGNNLDSLQLFQEKYDLKKNFKNPQKQFNPNKISLQNSIDPQNYKSAVYSRLNNNISQILAKSPRIINPTYLSTLHMN